jgi:hypothetical protein
VTVTISMPVHYIRPLLIIHAHFLGKIGPAIAVSEWSSGINKSGACRIRTHRLLAYQGQMVSSVKAIVLSYIVAGE